MSRTLGSVDSSQVWVDAFFFAMERKSRSTNAEGVGEAADFADAAVARFNGCMAAQSKFPKVPDPSRLGTVFTGEPHRTGTITLDTQSADQVQSLGSRMIQKELTGDRGIRVGDFEDHPRSPGPGTLDPG